MTEIIEPARPPLPDPPEGYKWERKEIPLRYPRAITTRRGPLSSDGIGDNEYSDLPSAEELNGINRLGSTLASPSTEESRRQIDADELRIDLKAETGFSSYADYVNAYAAKIPYLENILNHLEIPSLVLTRFTILDLSKEESSRPRVIPRCYSQSAMSIVTSLRQPPANVAVQIVLWNSLEYVSDGLVSALGLGLKIDPRFFGALCNERRRHLGPKHVTIGGAVATVVRRYDPNKLDAVPIVFIARVHCEPVLAKAIEEEIGDTVPFQYPAIETYPFYSDPNVQGSRGEGSDTEKYDHPNYARLLKWCLEKEGGQAVGVTGSVLQPLIPLFYLNIFRVRNLCESIRHEYHGLDNGLASFNETERETVTSGLPKERLRLRVMVEDSEDALDHFLRYVDSQKSADLLSTKSWMKADEDIKRTHREAVRLEAQIRDYLQLQVGEWALQESKKSIELSNRQIEEGKRGQSCSSWESSNTID